MSFEEAAQAIQALKDAPVHFNDDKTRYYVAQVREFVRRSRQYCERHGRPLYSPFISLTNHEDLPPELADGILSVIQMREWSPFCVTAFREHVAYLFFKEEIPEAQRDIANVYEPLFHLLLEGGDFYEHHGDICVGDAATVLLRRD